MVSNPTPRALISLVTLGCAKNEVDSVHMRNRLVESGFRIVGDPAAADVIIVNTCSFIQSATEESLETILELLELPTIESKKSRLIVAGCMPARYGEDLAAELPEVETLIPCSKEDDIVSIVESVVSKIPDLKDLSEEILSFSTELMFESEGFADQPFAYVKISDGCNRFCSFCAIPYIRGRYHSFSRDVIIDEIDDYVKKGVKEIILIAQDTGRWGSDFDEKDTLAHLLEDLANRHPYIWFRVMYIQPEGITDELISIVSKHENICSYFDIPFQHVNPSLLKAMNRKGSRESFVTLVEQIRHEIPDITLRTTLIAGFPGESEEMFEELCEFVEEIDFDYVGVFPYSQEEGTKAASLPDQINEEIKIERSQILRDIADSISISRIAARVGNNYDVLVLGAEEDGQLYGRAQCQAPEVDGVVYLDRGIIGEFRRITITDTLFYEMEGA